MIIKNFETYDGSILQDRFAYQFFRDKVLRTGNIIAGRSPAKVEADFMVDKQDLIDKDFIYSDDMIHFLIEIPDISLFAGICFQRLFNSVASNILATKYLKCDIEVDGDDIFVHKEHEQGGIVQQKGKASVSIAKYVNGAVLIHTGINVKAGKRAPAFAFSTNLSDEHANEFMKDCIEMFYGMSHDLFVASTKLVG
jgi:hypothetical protein